MCMGAPLLGYAVMSKAYRTCEATPVQNMGGTEKTLDPALDVLGRQTGTSARNLVAIARLPYRVKQ